MSAAGWFRHAIFGLGLSSYLANDLELANAPAEHAFTSFLPSGMRDLPVVVSMGGLAASGGYYVAMANGGRDDVIYADVDMAVAIAEAADAIMAAGGRVREATMRTGRSVGSQSWSTTSSRRRSRR